jgi:hypothetical protein
MLIQDANESQVCRRNCCRKRHGRPEARKPAVDYAEVTLQSKRNKAEMPELLMRIGQAQEPLKELCDMVRLMTKIVLLASGFHQHARRWKKRRALYG